MDSGAYSARPPPVHSPSLAQAIERWFELREAEARGENFKDIALVVNQTLVRLKLIAVRFKELVGGAVTSVAT